jgi:glycosyltransferase involved in cell wall biosynthesis
MRILMVVLTTRETGGLEGYTRQVALSLARGGHEVSILVALESPDQANCWGALRPIGLAPRNQQLRRLHVRTWRRSLAKRLRSEGGGYDCTLVMHPFAAISAVRGGIGPFWAWTYGLEVWNDWDPNLLRGLDAAERVVAISHDTAARVSRRLPSKNVAILHPSVDPALFRPAESPSVATVPRRLLTVARLASNERLKGHDIVIRNLRAIESRAGTAVEYWIAGDGDDRRRLERLAQKCGVEAEVRFLGRLAPEDLVAAYQGCDLFVMPSRSEGFGVAYLEASACGKPVIGSTVGGAPEAVMDGVTGFCVNPDSDRELVDAVASLLIDRNLAEEMGHAGRRRVDEEFTLPRFERELQDLLQGR